MLVLQISNFKGHEMKKLVIIFALWVAVSYPVYRYIGPLALIAYGLLSMVLFFVWTLVVSGKKADNPND